MSQGKSMTRLPQGGLRLGDDLIDPQTVTRPQQYWNETDPRLAPLCCPIFSKPRTLAQESEGGLRWPVPLSKAGSSCTPPAEKQKLKQYLQDLAAHPLGSSGWHPPVPNRSVCVVGVRGSAQLPEGAHASDGPSGDPRAVGHSVFHFSNKF